VGLIVAAYDKQDNANLVTSSQFEWKEKGFPKIIDQFPNFGEN